MFPSKDYEMATFLLSLTLQNDLSVLLIIYCAFGLEIL